MFCGLSFCLKPFAQRLVVVRQVLVEYVHHLCQGRGQGLVLVLVLVNGE